MSQNFRNIVSFVVVRFGKILESMDPQTYLIVTMLLTELKDISVPSLSNIEIEQVIPHI